MTAKPLPTDDRPEVVIFVGIQGSGKSTLYQQRFAATHEHISKDLMSRSADKTAQQRRLLALALRAGRSVVVDNTNVLIQDREAIIHQAREAGARVVCYFLDAPLADCLRRNNRREGRGKIPAGAIVTAIRRLEEPTLGEGFDALYVARLKDPENRFEIEEVKPKPRAKS